MNEGESTTEDKSKTEERFVKNLASRLKKVRLELGLSQDGTAEASGFSQGWISAIERDKLAGVDYIVWLAEKSKTPLDYFIYDETDEVELLRTFRKLESQQKDQLLDVAKGMAYKKTLFDDFKLELGDMKENYKINGPNFTGSGELVAESC